ncbi:hypothetical protein E2C01_098056 [Portunus trituberculatus]|uniref:Uncharacterized protein n=1 Tax=Portunus trituberculatus TaxID=210409 RepID=A0A5B7K090_PORTR|nr:hypothetical protein [Portunus trituberculatus]
MTGVSWRYRTFEFSFRQVAHRELVCTFTMSYQDKVTSSRTLHTITDLDKYHLFSEIKENPRSQ